ncbi:MAG: hypothetical protein SFY81_07800, partial [Verrucomicrobiota bacterium]|nr:hypothetical protein [Verrucomicrobiota bacterium]
MRHFAKALTAILLFSSAFQTTAEIVYDNSSNNLGKFETERLEYGDEINLGGVARTLTDFSFRFYAQIQSFQGDESARVRFYANDGPRLGNDYIMPGTLLWESPFFTVVQGF